MRHLVLLLLCLPCYSQTISPIIQECGRKCSHEVILSNNSLTPMVAVISAYSFTVVDRRPQLRKLDEGVNVQLSEQSAKIRPKDSHSFDYKITCLKLPCSVAIYATMSTGKPNSEGIVLKLALPHMVYICEKEKDCRKTILGE